MWSYSLFYYTKCGLTNGHCLFQECSVSYWTELILLLNAQAISKYRKIQKTVASLVKIVKYWAFLSESGNTMWCLYVWYTHRAMFVGRAVRLFLSTSRWLDICLLWKSGSGPFSAVFSEWSHLCLRLCHYLKQPFQESVLSLLTSDCSVILGPHFC